MKTSIMSEAYREETKPNKADPVVGHATDWHGHTYVDTFVCEMSEDLSGPFPFPKEVRMRRVFSDGMDFLMYFKLDRVHKWDGRSEGVKNLDTLAKAMKLAHPDNRTPFVADSVLEIIKSDSNVAEYLRKVIDEYHPREGSPEVRGLVPVSDHEYKRSREQFLESLAVDMRVRIDYRAEEYSGELYRSAVIREVLVGRRVRVELAPNKRTEYVNCQRIVPYEKVTLDRTNVADLIWQPICTTDWDPVATPYELKHGRLVKDLRDGDSLGLIDDDCGTAGSTFKSLQQYGTAGKGLLFHVDAVGILHRYDTHIDERINIRQAPNK